MSKTIYDVVSDFIKIQKARPNVLRTGFSEIDCKLKDGGLRDDCLVYIYAKSGVGKSYFLVNWAYRLIKEHDKIKIAIFSMEMPESSIMERFTQLIFSINPSDIRGFINVNVESFKEKLDKIGFFNKIYINDECRTLNGIEQYIIDNNPDIVFIDHLHLILSPMDNIYEKTNYIVGGLFNLKKKYPLTRIVCLVQQKRTDRETAGSCMPYLEDAKGSGIIEETADLIIGLCRPEISPSCPEKFRDQIHGGLIKRRYPSHERNEIILWNYNRFSSELTYLNEKNT